MAASFGDIFIASVLADSNNRSSEEDRKKAESQEECRRYEERERRKDEQYREYEQQRYEEQQRQQAEANVRDGFWGVERHLSELSSHIDENLNVVRIDIQNTREEIETAKETLKEELFEDLINDLNQREERLQTKVNDLEQFLKTNLPKLMMEHYATLHALAKKMGVFDQDNIENLPKELLLKVDKQLAEQAQEFTKQLETQSKKFTNQLEAKELEKQLEVQALTKQLENQEIEHKNEMQAEVDKLLEEQVRHEVVNRLEADKIERRRIAEKAEELNAFRQSLIRGVTYWADNVYPKYLAV